MASKYYLIGSIRDWLEGPYNLKEALIAQEDNLNIDVRCVIAKVIIDEEGREIHDRL